MILYGEFVGAVVGVRRVVVADTQFVASVSGVRKFPGDGACLIGVGPFSCSVGGSLSRRLHVEGLVWPDGQAALTERRQASLD